MHINFDASISPATTRSPFFAPLSGASSSRVSFARNLPNPTRFCGPIRAVNNGSVKPEATFYERLGVPETGTLPEIKQAYKQLARKYHPDVSPADRVEEFTERFIRVQEAYETLSDPMRRALYDRDMAMGIHLAFSSRKMYRYDEETMEDKSEWKSRWQSQLSGLKKRSMYRDARGNSSWGARMRIQKNDSPADE